MNYHEDEHIKETFAHFGLAVYEANCFETGLVNSLMFIDFYASQRRKALRNGGEGMTRERYEAEFDTFMAHHFAQTLGNLVKRVNEIAQFDDELKVRIGAAKKRRDFLIHHFWRERAVEFATSAGRTTMIHELKNDVEMFERLDDDVVSATQPMREALGIKKEFVRAFIEKFEMEVKEGRHKGPEPWAQKANP